MAVRLYFMGMGHQVLEPGYHMWWGASPTEHQFGAQRVLISVDGDPEFAIKLHGWRVGKLLERFHDPLLFMHGSDPAWLKPLGQRAGATVYVEIGEEIELEVENVGAKTVKAAGGFLGTVEVPPFDSTKRKTLIQKFRASKAYGKFGEGDDNGKN